MNAAMLMLVASTMAAPQPAANASSVSPNFGIGHQVTFVSDDVPSLDQARPPGSSASPTHQMHGKQVMVIAQAGIQFCCSTTGFMVGVGAAFMPIADNDKVEINADGNFQHFGGNGFNISVNGQYDMHMSNSKMTPFFGGGLDIAHFPGSTNAGLQLLGGIQAEMSSGRAVRAQIRFAFVASVTVTELLFGFAF
jgi:hypothetical protein